MSTLDSVDLSSRRLVGRDVRRVVDDEEDEVFVSGVVVRPSVPETVRRLGVAVSASASKAARAFLEQIAALDL